MSLSGPNGVGHRRRQSPEECRALTLPMPHAVYGAPLQLTGPIKLEVAVQLEKCQLLILLIVLRDTEIVAIAGTQL